MKTVQLTGCIIRDVDGKILLLHRNASGRVQWEIPGGKAEDGEELATAAVREVQEETGVAVEIIRELGTKSFTQPQDDRTLVYTWFSAKIVSGSPRVMEPDVHDDCRYLGIDEMQQITYELSPNTLNFVQELRTGRIVLQP